MMIFGDSELVTEPLGFTLNTLMMTMAGTPRTSISASALTDSFNLAKMALCGFPSMNANWPPTFTWKG